MLEPASKSPSVWSFLGGLFAGNGVSAISEIIHQISGSPPRLPGWAALLFIVGGLALAIFRKEGGRG